jgi:signal peptidase I
MRKATKTQWIFFSIATALYLAFTVWDGNYWLLLGIPVIFDVYISKFIPWGAWKNSKNKSLRKVAEWTDAIVFALIAVYFINIFIFQMYKIPSSSLEKSLLVGDYLVVNKFSYGPRVPNTPLSFPLVQHTLPIINTKSYIEWPRWDYKRLKGLGDVKRNDIVVFNYPAGDTIAFKVQNPDYYFSVFEHGWDRVNSDKNTFGDIVYRPVDRRENYVKRCIGLPGDSLQIIDNNVYIDGKPLPTPKNAQFNYFVETQGGFLNDKQFRTLGVSEDDYKRSLINSYQNSSYAFELIGIEKNAEGNFNPVYQVPLTSEALAKLEKSGWARSIHIETDAFGGGDIVYPYDYNYGWTRDNYGPIWIPAKGATIQLSTQNLSIYARCIRNYEGNTLEVKDNQILINGTPTTAYTFKYNYYFMMGDNRHNSADSRSWGFVPEDHVVGKPVLIWFSVDKDRNLLNGGIRWKRLFRTVSAQ